VSRGRSLPPLEKGDGIVSVTCEKRDDNNGLYDEAVTSGRPPVKKGGVVCVSKEITSYLSLVLRLIRWRTNSEGRAQSDSEADLEKG